MQNGNDPGKFRQLDEIIYLQDYPEYRYLSTIAENCMQIVCDCKGTSLLNLVIKVIHVLRALFMYHIIILPTNKVESFVHVGVAEIGSTKFFRLNDSKVLAWMLCKVWSYATLCAYICWGLLLKDVRLIILLLTLMIGRYNN